MDYTIDNSYFDDDFFTTGENLDQIELFDNEEFTGFEDSFKDVFNFSTGALVGGLFITIIVTSIISAAIAIFQIVATWKMFDKAEKPGWAAIIPFYNNWVLFETGDIDGWKSLLALIPLVGPIIFLVFSIMAFVNISKHFEKGTGFAIGLLLLPPVFYGILGFGSATYKKDII